MSAVLDRGAFVVSIDTEMAWGLVHRPELDYRYDRERPDLDRLLELFDRYEIPATFAIVGHLLLDGCQPVDGVKHPEIVRPDYDWFAGDWFDADPCTDADRHETWYAPDLVPRILSAATDHEIGSHGFSHVIAGDPGCSRESFQSELRASKDAAARWDLELRSLVHPRNRIGHLDAVVEAGFVAYRGRRPALAGGSSPWSRVVDRAVGSERTAIRPILEEGGIWNLPATILFDVDAHPRTWRLWTRQVIRRLGQSVDRRSLFHLWFHPHNLRDRPDIAFTALERICAAAARHRARGRLDTVTMGRLADDLAGRAST